MAEEGAAMGCREPWETVARRQGHSGKTTVAGPAQSSIVQHVCVCVCSGRAGEQQGQGQAQGWGLIPPSVHDAWGIKAGDWIGLLS